MELLRYLNSPEYKQAQAEQWQRVRGSYAVRAPLGGREAARLAVLAAGVGAAGAVALLC